jgi:hypothetical protein
VTTVWAQAHRCARTNRRLELGMANAAALANGDKIAADIAQRAESATTSYHAAVVAFQNHDDIILSGLDHNGRRRIRPQNVRARKCT